MHGLVILLLRLADRHFSLLRGLKNCVLIKYLDYTRHMNLLGH